VLRVECLAGCSLVCSVLGHLGGPRRRRGRDPGPGEAARGGGERQVGGGVRARDVLGVNMGVRAARRHERAQGRRPGLGGGVGWTRGARWVAAADGQTAAGEGQAKGRVEWTQRRAQYRAAVGPRGGCKGSAGKNRERSDAVPAGLELSTGRGCSGQGVWGPCAGASSRDKCKRRTASAQRYDVPRRLSNVPCKYSAAPSLRPWTGPGAPSGAPPPPTAPVRIPTSPPTPSPSDMVGDTCEPSPTIRSLATCPSSTARICRPCSQPPSLGAP